MGRKKRVGQRTPNFVDPITIGFDRLQILIQEFAKRLYDKWFWLTPLAIAITIGVTLIVSDFTDRFGLKAVEWRDLTFIALGIFVIWTMFAIVKAIQHQSVEQLMDRIGGESHSPIRNYALTFFRAKDANGTSFVLVYFDTTWKCYLMPFVGLQPGQSNPSDVSEYATQQFSLPKTAFTARELDGLEVRSDKVSESSGKPTKYRFLFYFMKVGSKHQNLFLQREFEVQEREYKWLTVEQLLGDPVSRELNGEVFSFMRDNPSAFVADRVPTSLDKSIGE